MYPTFFRSRLAIAVTWVLTKLLTPILIGVTIPVAAGDVYYYQESLAKMSFDGLARTLIEYPPPAVAALELPYLLGAQSPGTYLVTYAVMMLLTDALFTLALLRMCRRWRPAGWYVPVWWWMAFTLLMSPLAYVRFDLWTAVLVAAALITWRKHPYIAGSLTALGAGLKLWPGILWLVQLVDDRRRLRATAGFVVGGIVLVLTSIVSGGWDRLFSPLSWQSGRGLQIESVPATLTMLARLFTPDSYSVALSPFKAFEIFGPGVSESLLLSTVLTALGFVTMAAVLWWWWRSDLRQSVVAVGLVMFIFVSVMIITNKTLSPQYLLWLGPLTAALLFYVHSDQGQGANIIRRLSWLMLILAALTTVIYPIMYDGLLQASHGLWLWSSTLILATRNVLLFVMVWWAIKALLSLQHQKLSESR